MKYLTILLLILYSCGQPTPDTRPLITQRFVVFYLNSPDTINFDSKDNLRVNIVEETFRMTDGFTTIYFETIVPIKKLN